MIGRPGMKPMISLISISGKPPVSRQIERRNIAITYQSFLSLCQLHLRLEQLKLIEVFRQSGQSNRSDTIRIDRQQADFFFCRIIHDVLQHIKLLRHHRLRIVILYFQIFQIDIHPLQVNFHCHSIIKESLCDISQFFQSGDIGFYQCNLFRSDLSQIVHFTDLQDQIFPCLFIRKPAHLIHNLCYGNRSIESLIIKRHLQFYPGIGTILQRSGDIIRYSIGRAVSY